jgi:hypothetical protein
MRVLGCPLVKLVEPLLLHWLYRCILRLSPRKLYRWRREAKAQSQGSQCGNPGRTLATGYPLASEG